MVIYLCFCFVVISSVFGQTNYHLGTGISDMTGLVSEGALVSVISEYMCSLCNLQTYKWYMCVRACARVCASLCLTFSCGLEYDSVYIYMLSFRYYFILFQGQYNQLNQFQLN